MVRAIEKVLGNPVERRRLAGFDYAGYAASAGVQSRPAQQGYASRQSQPSRGADQRGGSKQQGSPRHSNGSAPQQTPTQPVTAHAQDKTVAPEGAAAKPQRRRTYWRRQGTQA